ncbi:coiled-coil domain-containing protein 12 isoform X1 [Choloepus didactylus]|uniref:coiled-coil domain-containing protein 12 isoform X1 n=1 Tax=Choloepus didactylus TaxID=27675 RepID=UPI00189D5AF1|nr:coiled-coil domain-containing protein 12 isoform X1 [Choloepus didactylus]
MSALTAEGRGTGVRRGSGCLAGLLWGLLTPSISSLLYLAFSLPNKRHLVELTIGPSHPSPGAQHRGWGQCSRSRTRRAGRQCWEADRRFLSPGGLAPPGSPVCAHILDLFAWLQAVPACPGFQGHNWPACAPYLPSKDKEDGEPKNKQLREEEEEGERHRELRLRNYVPEDEDLKRRRVPQAKPVAVEEKVKEQLEAARPEPVIEEVDLANLAPRKPDWDLKRDVAKKLEKLEKRTQRAIAELIRERLKGQEDSLASTVDATAEQEACDSD